MTLAALPSLRRAQESLPLLIVALALVLATALPLLSPFLIRACADALFAALIFHGLLATGLRTGYTLAITALSFVQAGLLFSAAGRAGSIWLAVAIYCVARAASDFVQHRDARRVMALGGALSLAQVLDPMGAVLAIFLLPVCVGLPRAGEGRDKMGLFALLIFVPVVTAMVLAITRGMFNFDPMHFARSELTTRAITHVPLWLLLLGGFASAPVLWLTLLVARLRRAASLVTIYPALAALAATAAAYLLGAERDMASVLTVAAAASAAALCSWPRLPRHADLALAATALSAVMSWLLLNLPSLRM
jgi:hypothetical protein